MTFLFWMIVASLVIGIPSRMYLTFASDKATNSANRQVKLSALIVASELAFWFKVLLLVLLFHWGYV